MARGTGVRYGLRPLLEQCGPKPFNRQPELETPGYDCIRQIGGFSIARRMKTEYDPQKDAINRAKHGVSLALAQHMDLAAAFIEPDQRFSYGEDRFQALGPINGRLHLLAYTMRGGTVRAISLRKANNRERKHYDRRT